MRLRFRLSTYVLAVYASGLILALAMTALSRYLSDSDQLLDQALPPRSGYIELLPVFRPDSPFQMTPLPAGDRVEGQSVEV